MSNNSAQRLFYVVKESDKAYSLYSIHTDHLILAEVTSNVISDFLFLNEPTNPAYNQLESSSYMPTEAQINSDYNSYKIQILIEWPHRISPLLFFFRFSLSMQKNTLPNPHCKSAYHTNHSAILSNLYFHLLNNVPYYFADDYRNSPDGLGLLYFVCPLYCAWLKN